MSGLSLFSERLRSNKLLQFGYTFVAPVRRSLVNSSARAGDSILAGIAPSDFLWDLLENSLCYRSALVDAVIQMLASVDL